MTTTKAHLNNMKPCPVPGCERRCSSSYLMCRPHWAKVPKDLQNQVYRTWRNGDLAEYVEASEAAIDIAGGIDRSAS